MVKQKGLGRGLDAIFESEELTGPKAAKPMAAAGEISVELISPNPKQPRRHFDEEALEELADSVRVLGVIQPVTVARADGDRYIIISGERRWRAARMAGLETVPVYVREVDDQTLHEMALVENIQRQDLNAMEVAFSLQRLMDECALTQDRLSERVGKKRSTIANYLRLLRLPDEVQLAVKEGFISMGHAKAIASAPESAQVGLLKKTVKKGLSVRQTEEAATAATTAGAPKSQLSEEHERELPESYSRLVELLERVFGSNISLRSTSKGQRKIVIEVSNDGDIERFIDKLKN
ncbi:MAG: ParB/RepB/Spo0J family partition protein [Alistipes sp.]|jgi:ParB family chromosome partitioning protein|nr:ParB/RepB/Spo0J family partition protein [Alistipes sp.]